MGSYVESTITADINDTEGAQAGGAKMNIYVADASIFSDKPTVTIDTGSYVEAFMCDNIDVANNMLRDCIRGKRYYKFNIPQNHKSGATIKQDFAWMVQEADSGDWRSYPHDFGEPHMHYNKVKETEDFGRWALRIENNNDEYLTNFPHVLHPSVDMSRVQMADSLVINIYNQGMIGAHIKRPQSEWVVILTKTQDLQNSLTYEISSTNNNKHLITGLVFGTYDIYQNNNKIGSITTSNQNTLYFQTSSGGVFQVVRN
jgi:hypothetical protein